VRTPAYVSSPMAGYNLTRTIEELLAKTNTLPPSFTIHLHLEYWTLNNGSKFLYDSQVAVSLNFLLPLYPPS
jgi:transcription factor SPT20